LFLDQPQELGGAGDVGTLAHVDEQGVLVNGESFQARQPHGRLDLRDGAGRVFGYPGSHRLDVLGSTAAAAADNVQKARLGELFDNLRHFLGGLVVFAKLVGQPGVRVGADIKRRFGGQLFNIGTQQIRTQGTVQADADGARVSHGVQEGFRGLSGQGASGCVGNGSGDHDRQFGAAIPEVFLGCENGSLGVEGVENGFDQDDVGTTVDQPFDGLVIVFHQLVKAGVTEAGVVHAGGNWRRAGGRPDGARYKAGAVGLGRHHLIGRFAGDPGGCDVQLIDN